MACKVDLLRKLEVSSVESDRSDSGARVDMVAGPIALVTYAVKVAAVVAHASALRSGVICLQESG